MKLPLLARVALWPFSLLYGQVTRWRAGLYARGIFKAKRLGRPVISVGNLTVGGTGKTPMVMWLTQRLIGEGKRVGILTRGYKGSGGASDEVELMKQRLPRGTEFGVGANRCEQGKRLEASVDVFVLDDGFQHLRLARDVNILLIDAAQPLAKQTMLPTGRLREPISAMTRADVLVFTRTETVPGTGAAIERFHDYPVFSATTRLVGFRRFGEGTELMGLGEIGSGPFYAFCGIGNPLAFFQDLKNWNVSLAAQCEFADHHRYDARDLAELQAAARTAGATALLTTEKDAQNLRGCSFGEFPVYLAVIDLEIPKESALLSFIHEKLQARTFAA